MTEGLKEFIETKSYSRPFDDKDLSEAYKLGQTTILIELNKMIKGMVVNGILMGVITEEQLNDKLVEVENA